MSQYDARPVFGNEDAKFDELLEECYVSPSGTHIPKPILRGRWGTGKTALLFHENKELMKLLINRDNDEALLWYIDETRFDIPSLFDLKTLFLDDEKRLQYTLQGMWEGEILRTMAQLLDRLWEYYGRPDGDHWKWIRDAVKAERAAKSVWKLLPEILTMFKGNDVESLSESIQRKIRDDFGDIYKKNINKCLRDIEEADLQPVIAIEPIETPQSDIESDDGSLADAMITSLINLFLSTYGYRKDIQPIRIRISVPWHRANIGKLSQPQKYRQNEGRMSWSESTLKKFIEKRISYEFKQVGRHFTPKGNHGYWEELFGDTIENEYCNRIRTSSKEIKLKEQTFQYFLRHTHRRPRDLQRLVREAVEHQAAHFDQSIEEVLKGRREKKILKRMVIAAVGKCSLSSADDRIREASRRFEGIKEVVAAFNVMTPPFDINAIKTRLEQTRGKKIERDELLHMIKILWDAGIIGVELTPTTDFALSHLKEVFRRVAFKEYNTSEGRVDKFFLFEYNSEYGITELMTNFGDHSPDITKDVSFNLVFHPIMVEKLQLRPTRQYPIGA